MQVHGKARRILVISNMYPDSRHPSYGVFVKRFVEQAEDIGCEVALSVMLKADGCAKKAIAYLKFYVKTFFNVLFKNYDLVYVHYPSFSAPSALLAHRLRAFPLYVNVHGSDVLAINSQQRKMLKFTERSIRIAEKVVVPSRYFAGIVEEKYRIDPNIIEAYPSGGVDDEVFHPLSEKEISTIKRHLGMDGDALTVCFASRITEGKGWDTYLAAVKEVLDKNIKLNILLIGEGDQSPECDAMIRRLNLSERIIRLPLQSQEKLCKLYNVADIFVFPSRRSESLGLVGVEAMACGTPVIACDCGGPKDYVIPGKNGWLIPSGDSHALAQIIGLATAEKKDLEEMGRYSLALSREYSRERSRARLAEILFNR